MTKKFLTITSQSNQSISWKDREAYVKEFTDNLAVQFAGELDVQYATYQYFAFQVVNGVPSIRRADTGEDLTSYNFVHFKNWMYELEMASTIARYLHRNKIPFANTEVNAAINTGKLSQMFELAWAGLPVPDTLVCASNENLIELMKDNEHFTFPCILKAVDGSKGDDNYLAKDHAQLTELLREHTNVNFMVQNFIPNDGDLRLLFIGLDREPLVFSRVSDGSSHLNNTSKGGAGKFIDSGLDPHYLRDARKAAEVLNREIGGVDIIVNKETGKHYVLEVNTTPALATGYGGDRKVAAYTEFLKETLFGNEEDEE